MPNIGEAFRVPTRRADLIAADADFGRIVCHCERVTRGEICAPRRGTTAGSLDGLRRARARFRPLPGLLLRGGGHPPDRRTRCQAPAVIGLDGQQPCRRARSRGPAMTRRRANRRRGARRPRRRASNCAGSASGEYSSSTARITPGGVPRHSAHTGFGLRDLHRVMSGPGSPVTTRRRAAAGVDIRTAATVTDWDRRPRSVTMARPRGSRRSAPAPCCSPPAVANVPAPRGGYRAPATRGAHHRRAPAARVYLDRQRLGGRARSWGRSTSASPRYTRSPTPARRSSGWSPSSLGARASPSSRWPPRCGGGFRCGRRRPCAASSAAAGSPASSSPRQACASLGPPLRDRERSARGPGPGEVRAL